MPAEMPAPGDEHKRACALIILGMHRSGTSALAGVLARLGVDVGPHLQEGNEFNSKGYWEHRGVVQIQDELLHRLGSSWRDIRPLPVGWEQGDAANAARTALTDLLRRDFSASDLWLVKDPRTCRLLPLWRAVLIDLGVIPSYVLTVRHPAEVAASLAHRDHMPPSRAHLLWLQHTIEIERQTRGENRVIVTYDGMLNDWPSVIDNIASSLDIGLSPRDEARQEAVREFLSPQLRHHQNPAHPPNDSPALYGLAVSVFNAFARSPTSQDLATDLDKQGEVITLVNEILREIDVPDAAAIAPGSVCNVVDPSSHLLHGIRLLDAGQLDAACESLSQALDETPDSAEVLVQLGRLALMSCMPGQACDFFQEAIVHAEDGLEKVQEYGRGLLRGGQTEAGQIVLLAIEKGIAPPSRTD